MVKTSLVKTSAGKTKHLKVESSSDDEKNSSEDENLKRKSKKIPSSKSKSRHQVSSSSSSEPKKKRKDKKKKVSSESSEEVVKKKKKQTEESSESDRPRHHKQKKHKKQKHQTSSEEDQKPKKKSKKFESDSESEDQPKPRKHSKKPKKVSSSSEETPKKKDSKVKSKPKSSEPDAQKPSSQPLKIKKIVESSSEEEDPYKPTPSKVPEKQSKVQSSVKPSKPAESSSSQSSSANSAHSSDSAEQDLVLTKSKKEKKAAVKETLPLKRINPELVSASKPKAVESQQTSAPAPGQSAVPSAGSSNDIELFIGNLAFEASEADLRQLFSKYGEIENISMPHQDGSPRGIAFVAFASPQSAQSALILNNTEFMGRNLRISFSSNKRSRPAGQSSSFTAGARQAPGSSSTVFVGNIPYSATEDMIQDFFSKCGEIKQVRLAKLETGELKGFAHVEFYEAEAASSAVGLAGSQLEGRAVKVELSAPKQPPGSRNPGPASRPMKPVGQSFAGQKIKL